MSAAQCGGEAADEVERVLQHAGTQLADRLAIPLDDLGDDGLDRLWERTGAQDDLWRATRRASI